MLAFGSAAAGGGGIFSNSLVVLLGFYYQFYIWKFCGWAKNLSFRADLKDYIYPDSRRFGRV